MLLQRWVVVIYSKAEGVSVSGDLFTSQKEADAWADGPNARDSLRGGLDGTEVPQVFVFPCWVREESL